MGDVAPAPPVPLDVLVPTCDRPAALAVTLTSLSAQSEPRFRVIISDQSDGDAARSSCEVLAAIRVLRSRGRPVELLSHHPRRGMAEHRQFLLDRSSARYVLYLDDDLILEPDVITRMGTEIGRQACGFVGCAVIGLSHLDDVRPQEQAIEWWEGRVTPETVRPLGPGWDRHRLHNAANLRHVEQALALGPGEQRAYKVAWVGGCVMYDANALRQVGGFEFWRELPSAHCGEDVLAQLRVMERFGGCGLIPSGVYHQELPTTLEDRRVNAPEVLMAR